MIRLSNPFLAFLGTFFYIWSWFTTSLMPSVLCGICFGLEQEVHHKLDAYRVNNNREFFQISLDEAKKTVGELGKRYL